MNKVIFLFIFLCQIDYVNASENKLIKMAGETAGGGMDVAQKITGIDLDLAIFILVVVSILGILGWRFYKK